jgi:hypothetical protein
VHSSGLYASRKKTQQLINHFFRLFLRQIMSAIQRSTFDRAEDGKVEEETRKAITPPAWSALQLVADGLEDETYWYLEPGERTRYDFLASLPADTAIVLLKCVFYDKNWHNETVRKSYAVPATLTISQKSKPIS